MIFKTLYEIKKLFNIIIFINILICLTHFAFHGPLILGFEWIEITNVY